MKKGGWVMGLPHPVLPSLFGSGVSAVMWRRLLTRHPLWRVCSGFLEFSFGLNSFHKPSPN